jgi:hypothetical protein
MLTKTGKSRLGKRYSHAFDIAFEVHSDHTGGRVTADELRTALRARLNSMDDREIIEACGKPFDTDDYQED